MPLQIKLDPAETEAILVRFLRDYVQDTGRKNVVIGLSGGIDSAVVAALAVRALGPGRVHAFWLPSGASAPQDAKDAERVAAHLGIALAARPIQPLVDAAQETLGGATDKAIVANLMARARMILLHAEAARHDAIVLGTGNKSELLVGYFTKYGDGGTDLLPIGDLYKTQVRELAAHLGLPDDLITKAPSAGLWSGQTDEGELGITYDHLDRILLGLEIDLAPERIALEAGVNVEEVHRIERMRTANEHKRRSPLVCKLGIRSLTTDWREPMGSR